jgi:hypothetical protein
LAQPPSHPVERNGEIAELVAKARTHRRLEVAALDGGRRCCHPAKSSRD